VELETKALRLKACILYLCRLHCCVYNAGNDDSKTSMGAFAFCLTPGDGTLVQRFLLSLSLDPGKGKRGGDLLDETSTKFSQDMLYALQVCMCASQFRSCSTLRSCCCSLSRYTPYHPRQSKQSQQTLPHLSARSHPPQYPSQRNPPRRRKMTTAATADDSSDGEAPNSSNIWGKSHRILERNDSCISIDFGGEDQGSPEASEKVPPPPQ